MFQVNHIICTNSWGMLPRSNNYLLYIGDNTMIDKIYCSSTIGNSVVNEWRHGDMVCFSYRTKHDSTSSSTSR